MAKPTPEKAPAAPDSRPVPRAFTVRDIRILEHGNGVVELVEVTYRGIPSSVRSIYKGAREVAMQDARLWEENKLGPDRFGDTGLGPRWNGDLAYPDYE